MGKVFENKEWNPQTKVVAKALTEKINLALPELEILFMGSAALELPGRSEIDLDILCKRKDIEKYVASLELILGSPKELTKSFASWEFDMDGVEVDCFLSDPLTSHVLTQKRNFDLLSANNDLLCEYLEIKAGCDQKPYSDYELAKKSFFEKLNTA